MNEKKPEYNLIRKSLANPKSLRAAINAMCFNCFGGTKDEMPDPGYSRHIGTCTSKVCPLHPHRPFQSWAEKKSEIASSCPSEGPRIDDQGSVHTQGHVEHKIK